MTWVVETLRKGFSGLLSLQRGLLGALSRVTSTGRFIPEIDALRFIAVMAVILFHSHGHFFHPNPKPFWQGDWNLVSYVVRTGWFGVQLFFAISGFILAMPFADHHLNGAPAIKLKKYFLRRLTRLEPPYIISLLVLIGVYLYFNIHSFKSMVPHFLAHLGYVHNIVYGDMTAPGSMALNHVAWSLEIEVQFYILAPLLCTVFAIRPPALRRAVILGGMGVATLGNIYSGIPFLSLTLAGQIHYFLIGFLLADFYLTDWKERPTRTYLWDAVGIPAWLGAPLLLSCGAGGLVVMPLVLVAAYVAAFRGQLLRHFFTHPWVAAIGGMCYTIYLYHVHMIWWAKVWLEQYLFGPVRLGTFRAVLHLSVVCLAVLAVCAVLFVLFEKPFMRSNWPSVFWQRVLRGVAYFRSSTRSEAMGVCDESEP